MADAWLSKTLITATTDFASVRQEATAIIAKIATKTLMTKSLTKKEVTTAIIATIATKIVATTILQQ